MTRWLLLLAALATAPTAQATTFTLARTLVNPSAAAADFFGSAVALAGNDVVIGARFEDAGSIVNAGAAYLWDGSSLRAIRNPTPAAGDLFGFAVAALGTDLLVSAPEHDAGAPRAGIIYRIDRSSGAVLRSYTEIPPVAGAKLGFALAALGTDVLAGAPFDGGGGAVLFDGQTGAVLQYFTSPTPATSDLFGRAVAAAGATAVIAAPFDDTRAVNAGAVHLFDAASGAFQRTLFSPRPNASDSFGLAVAADGNLVAVGSPYDHSTASNAGAVYLFDATTGALLRTLLSPAVDARFGAAVAIAGGRVLVGAPFADGDAVDVGRAYVFDAGTGELLATLENPSPQAGDQFGAAVALGGTGAVVGAWLDDTGADNAGAAYAFTDGSVPVPSTTSTSTTSATSTSSSSTSSSSTSTTTSSVTSSTVAPSTSTSTSSTSSSAPIETTATSSMTSTITTSSATTTPTTPEFPTTTFPFTALPPCDCEDADPCTIDTCTPEGQCRFDPVTGLDAVSCRLDALDTALHTTAFPLLGGPRLALRMQRKVARARALVETARQRGTTPNRVARAGRILNAFIGLVRHAQQAGRLTQATAESLLALSTDAASQLAPLRNALPTAAAASRP